MVGPFFMVKRRGRVFGQPESKLQSPPNFPRTHSDEHKVYLAPSLLAGARKDKFILPY